jgi:hypothetical protein
MEELKRREAFVRLSEILTGIRSDTSTESRQEQSQFNRAKPGDLTPRNTPIDLVGLYLSTVNDNGYGDMLDDLLAGLMPLADIPGAGARYVEGQLKDLQSLHGQLLRSVIKLWYLGTWYPPLLPPDRTRPEMDPPEAPKSGQKPGWTRWVGLPREVVSPQAYTEALVWKVMQAHPMAYSMSPFGYWAEDPPALSTFISVVSNKG